MIKLGLEATPSILKCAQSYHPKVVKVSATNSENKRVDFNRSSKIRVSALNGKN
jgi:hypothetical protein